MIKYIILIIAFATSTILYSQEGSPDIIRGDESFSFIVKTIDTNTNETLDGTNVYLYQTKKDKLIDSKVSQNGLVTFQIEPSTEYEVRTCNTGYLKNGISIFECNEGNEVLCSFGAKEYNFVAGGGPDKPKAVLKATVALQPLSIGSIFELANVYYDLDKATLRPSGKQELDDLVKIMNRNKSIKIELSSHTDSRASNEYNNKLSQERAQSCLDYLVSKGISADRIIPKGYGETKLKNNCGDNVKCTESEHQLNRRTEIEVLAYEPIVCAPSMDIDFKNKDLKIDPDDKK